MNIDETFFAFLSGFFASFLFREFIGALRVFSKMNKKKKVNFKNSVTLQRNMKMHCLTYVVY